MHTSSTWTSVSTFGIFAVNFPQRCSFCFVCFHFWNWKDIHSFIRLLCCRQAFVFTIPSQWCHFCCYVKVRRETEIRIKKPGLMKLLSRLFALRVAGFPKASARGSSFIDDFGTVLLSGKLGRNLFNVRKTVMDVVEKKQTTHQKTDFFYILNLTCLLWVFAYISQNAFKTSGRNMKEWQLSVLSSWVYKFSTFLFLFVCPVFVFVHVNFISWFQKLA